MNLSVKNIEGKTVGGVELDDSVFGIKPNLSVLHQTLVAQQANRRRGSASTKTRGEVQGSSRKIRGQKYTGRARQGSIRSPIRRGGGVTFGPQPRDYSQRLPKRMKRLAIRSALSGKAADGQLTVIDQFAFNKPQTKEMVRILQNLGVERSVLIVTEEMDIGVKTSTRNIPKAKVIPAAYLNVADMLAVHHLLMTTAAAEKAAALWGGSRVNLRRTRDGAPGNSVESTRASGVAADKQAAPEATNTKTRATAKATRPARKGKAKAAKSVAGHPQETSADE